MLTASFDPEPPRGPSPAWYSFSTIRWLEARGPRTTLVSSFRVNQNLNPLLEWGFLNDGNMDSVRKSV